MVMDDPSLPVDVALALSRSKLSKDETNTYKLVIYRPVEPLLQVGPQCGIVALAMASELGGFSYTVQNIFEKAKELKCTIQGELFDAHMIPVLCKKFNIEAKVHRWTKLEDLTDYLQSNHVCLMPYDADANHEPCKRLGHRAHWALIHGYVKLFPVREENHSDLVLVHHGKSRHVAAWSIRDLYESNLQLNEVDPKKANSEYCTPDNRSLLNSLNGLFIVI